MDDAPDFIEMKYVNDLRERASQAFDAKFRAEMADACMLVTITTGRIDNCCPEGALILKKLCLHVEDASIKSRRPFPDYARLQFGFEYDQHRSFQNAFDYGRDDRTPEAALGLLYRLRYS